jgi:hypothetical protein
MDPAGAPGAEFRDPDRIVLMERLERAMGAEVPPTAWACLWLSDMTMLSHTVASAEHQPITWWNTFTALEEQLRFVQTCAMTRCILPLQNH